MAKQTSTAQLADQLDRLVTAVLVRGVVIEEIVAALPDAGAKLAPLARIAAELRDLPSEGFKARLKADLERRAKMATPAKPVKPIPEGYRTITPYLTVREAPLLLKFLQQAFGAAVLFQGTGSAGGIHAEVRIGDSKVMVGGGGAYQGPWFPTSIHLKVDDADEVYARALRFGATSIHEPADFEYGERGAGIEDVSGNHWYLATPKGQTHFLPEMGSVTPYLHPVGAGKLIAFLKEAFGAEEVARHEEPKGTVVHAKVRVGDSIVEMGEAHAEYRPIPSMFYMYVNNADAAYHRALKAGAKSISAPADQPYGDRNAAVEDPFGNQWYIATHVKGVAH
jgi:PhnB protein